MPIPMPSSDLMPRVSNIPTAPGFSDETGGEYVLRVLIEELDGDYSPARLASIISNDQRLEELLSPLDYYPRAWLNGDMPRRGPSFDDEWLC